MSVTDSEISPPETDDYANCRECGELRFVGNLHNGVCLDCQPCPECDGEGCDECIEEVPVMPRADIQVAMDSLAEALSSFSSSTKHLIRETIAAHMNPEIQKLKDVIVGLMVVSANAVAEYAIATKDKLGQDEISQLKDSLRGLSVSNTYLLAKFIAHLGWEAERKELRESNAQLLYAAKMARQCFTDMPSPPSGMGSMAWGDCSLLPTLNKLDAAIEAAETDND